MIRLSRDSWTGLGLLLVMILLLSVAVIQETRSDEDLPRLLSTSTEPDGGMALYRWLDNIGYSVTADSNTFFGIPPFTNYVLLLDPTVPVTDGEWRLIERWVEEEGGTLILVGDGLFAGQLYDRFDVRLRFEGGQGVPLPETPLTIAPAIDALPQNERTIYFSTSRTDAVTLVSQNGRSQIITFPFGNGRVILSSLSSPFTNAGLQQPGNPELVRNLFSGQSGTIYFSDWHHGVRPSRNDAITNSNWLQQTPYGQAILFSAVTLFLFLLLRGQNFGRPVPLPQDLSRRGPLEYITAIANLSRRAGHRTAVLQDTHDRLKRRLGQRYRLSPALPDDQFVTQLKTYLPSLDEAALLHLLNRLSAQTVSEAELVQLSKEATEWMM